MTGRKPSLSPELQEDAAMLYRSGWTLHELSDHYGLTPQGMSLMLQRMGQPIRPPGRPSNDRGRQIARQYQSGNSLQHVADSWGLTVRAVRQILQQEGVVVRRGRPRKVQACA